MIFRTLVLCVALAAPATDGLLAQLRDRDPAVRASAIEGLRAAPGEDVSKAIAKAVRDRDPAVSRAAVSALGARGDETSVKALRAALRTFSKDAEQLPGVVVALGVARDAAAAAEVVKLARKSLGADPRLAEASIDALGSMRSPEAVGGLIELLAAAEPVRGGAAARSGHSRYLAGIRQSLGEVTGLPFRELVTWQEWWRRAKRDWRPSPIDVAEVTGSERRDDGWRFVLVRPGLDRWAFEQPKGAALRVRFVGPREEAGFAWVDVIVHAAREREPATLALAMAAAGERIREGLSDVKELRLEEAGRLGAEAARVCSAVGMLEGGRVTRRTTYVLERNGLVYVVEVHVASGASPDLTREIEDLLGSFRLL